MKSHWNYLAVLILTLAFASPGLALDTFIRQSDGTQSIFEVPGDDNYTQTYGVNDRGQIVGRYIPSGQTTSPFYTTAFLRQADETLEFLAMPNAFDTAFNDITNSGLILGSFSVFTNPAQTSSITTHFLTNATDFSSIVPIEGPGSLQLTARGINNRGQVVGNYFEGIPGLTGGTYKGFILDPDGTFTSFGVPSGGLTNPAAINDHGEIIGMSGHQAFLRRSDGSFEFLGAPFPTETWGVTDIDNAGNIIGTVGVHGFIRKPNGTFSLIDAPTAALTVAAGLNNRGQIVGYFVVPGPEVIVTPEPASLALFASGSLLLFLLSAIARKHYGIWDITILGAIKKWRVVA
jgi:uncharacterized membrane protein